MSKDVLVSVALPVWNREDTISECISSILGQTYKNFELIIVDDGSTDSTCSIISEFNDERIKLFRNEHNYIDSCNKALGLAKGDFIARMDSDDVMLPDRLALQLEYMQNHPDVDILGGAIICFGETDEYLYHYPQIVTAENLYMGNCICHPAVMMRRSALAKHGLKYEQEFIYAEDYRLWIQAIEQGLVIHNIQQPVIKYRLSNHQASCEHKFQQYESSKKARESLCRWMSRSEACDFTPIKPTHNKLTVIIPFLNEGEEVVNTVKSIRETVDNTVDIMVINDLSIDKYPYRERLKDFDVQYIFNSTRKGVAGSRDYGVSICPTPYFLLLDAHMRFYDNAWAATITSLLEEDDRRLLCCQTKFLGKNENGEVYLQEDCPQTFGALLKFSRQEMIPTVDWNFTEKHPDSPTEPIPIVLGAGYACSVRYWEYLKGLQGLRSYGSDEPYISLKVWLEGGRCLLLKHITIGHIYREQSPYKRYNEDEVYNHLLIAFTLFPPRLRCWVYAVALTLEKRNCDIAFALLKKQENEILSLKKYYARIFTQPFQLFYDFNLSFFTPDKNFIAAILNRTCDIAEAMPAKISQGDSGLYHGTAGILFWACQLHGLYKTEVRLATLINHCIAKLSSEINTIEKLNFEEGLTGIGWCLMYLQTKGLLNDSQSKSLLEVIAHKMLTADISTLDNSFDKGIGGVLAFYISIRSRVKNFPAYLEQRARTLAKGDAELRTIYFSTLYLSAVKHPESEVDFDFTDWLTAPSVLPKDSKFWSFTLQNGCLGTSLLAMRSWLLAGFNH